MKILKPVVVLIGLFTLAGCNEHTSKRKANSADFIISSFKGIPNEVDGCSCTFSENNEKFKNGEYLFTAGFDSIGFVYIDHNLIRLKLLSTEREPDTFGDTDHKEIYEGSDYKIFLDIKYKHSTGEEVWWNEGTIVIQNKAGRKKTKKFVGECGC
jgi:hypothetical protein